MTDRERTAFGGINFELIATRGAPERRYRVEIDGEPYRVRVHREGEAPSDGEDGELGLLVDLLRSKQASRREEGRRLILEEREPILPHNEDTTTVTVSLEASGIVVVEVSFRIGEVNPNFGW